jgi:hypothetical protein
VVAASALAIWLGCANAVADEIPRRNQMTQVLTLWDAVEALAVLGPLTKESVQTLLSAELAETDQKGNDIFQFYGSQPISLADGSVIDNADLRVKRKGFHPGFLVLRLAGRCVSLNEVRGRYSPLTLSDIPRGRSLDDATAYTALTDWWELSFSFKERERECLSSIAFKPRKTDPQR